VDYIVLARKYRPQSFDELIGQEAIARTIQNAIIQNRLPHAFLFSGPRGTGKTSAARILAKSLNCLSKSSPTDTPCNHCANCVAITKDNSPDVREIDGATHTQVEKIRELQENVIYAPVNSRYKIYIIDEVHMLTRSAFNALLKLIEEPPENVLFIFATTEPHKVLPTILSRCQRYDFQRIALQKIVAHLAVIAEKEEIHVDEQSLFLLAKYSEGCMRDALSMFDQLASFTNKNISITQTSNMLNLASQQLYYDYLQAIIDEKAQDALMLIQHVYTHGIDLGHFIHQFHEYIRNLLLIKSGVTSEEAVQLLDDDRKRLMEQAPLIHANILILIMNSIADLEYKLRDSRWPRLLVETNLFTLIHIRQGLTLQQIQERIDKLAGQIKSADHVQKTQNPIQSPAAHQSPQPPVSPSSPIIPKTQPHTTTMASDTVRNTYSPHAPTPVSGTTTPPKTNIPESTHQSMPDRPDYLKHTANENVPASPSEDNESNITNTEKKNDITNNLSNNSQSGEAQQHAATGNNNTIINTESLYKPVYDERRFKNGTIFNINDVMKKVIEKIPKRKAFIAEALADALIIQASGAVVQIYYLPYHKNQYTVILENIRIIAEILEKHYFEYVQVNVILMDITIPERRTSIITHEPVNNEPAPIIQENPHAEGSRSKIDDTGYTTNTDRSLSPPQVINRNILHAADDTIEGLVEPVSDDEVAKPENDTEHADEIVKTALKILHGNVVNRTADIKE